HQEHPRHIEPKCQQQERLQLVDLARRGAIESAKAAEERIRCKSTHVPLSEAGTTGARNATMVFPATWRWSAAARSNSGAIAAQRFAASSSVRPAASVASSRCSACEIRSMAM